MWTLWTLEEMKWSNMLEKNMEQKKLVILLLSKLSKPNSPYVMWVEFMTIQLDILIYFVNPSPTKSL